LLEVTTMRVTLLSLAVTALLPLIGCGSSGQDSRGLALSFARDNISCVTPADCCAVVDGCMGDMLLVSAADRAGVETLLAQAPQDMCVACIPPPVQVDCRAGRCVAVTLEPDGSGGTDYPSAFTASHCGTLTIPAGWQEKPASVDLSSGLHPATVIGCGD
jgi:hypothetical protein